MLRIFFIILSSVSLLIFIMASNAYALCCIAWNSNGYVDPDTGLFVGISELQNDHPFWQPLANITFNFQFLDENHNVIYQKEQSITHTLPINSGFMIPPAATLPFKVVLDDPDLSKKTKYFTADAPTHMDRSSKWKPADLIVSFNNIELIKSSQILGYKKWAVHGITEHIEAIPSSVMTLDSTKIEYEWSPTSKGIYVYEIYIWSDLETPEPLSIVSKHRMFNDQLLFVS